MKKILILLLGIIISVVCQAKGGGHVSVRGYVKKDGTYVQPHYRSDPDGNPYNNYSSKGNINPYTGEYGDKIPNPTYSGHNDNPVIFGSRWEPLGR